MGIFENIAMFFTDPAKMLVTVGSIVIAAVLFAMWKKYSKPLLLYAHLFFILSPLFYFAVSINCSMSLVKGLLEFCTTVMTKFILFLLPPVLAGTFIAGYLIIPWMYRRLGKQHSLAMFSKLCKQFGIKAELFLIDRAKPLAFTLGKRVFVSVGMFEALPRRELEAVLLHEIAHVKSRSAWHKFSTCFVRTFSPVAWFSAAHCVEGEEHMADEFAIKQQGTKRFLFAAKKKVNSFH